jgi:hypothetical protein
VYKVAIKPKGVELSKGTDGVPEMPYNLPFGGTLEERPKDKEL